MIVAAVKLGAWCQNMQAAVMQCNSCCSVDYARISQIQYSDYTPSRLTRPSSNHFLQEHCTIDEIYDTIRRPLQLYNILAQAEESERKLKGNYIQVEFADSYPGHDRPACPCKARGPRRSATAGATVTTRLCGVAEWTANGTVFPLCIRSRTERRRTAFRKRSGTKFSVSTDSGCSSASEESGLLPDVAREMDVEPSVVTYHDRLGGSSLLSCNGAQNGHLRRDFAAKRARTQQTKALVRPVPFQLPTADSEDMRGDSPCTSPGCSPLLQTLAEDHSYHPVPAPADGAEQNSWFSSAAIDAIDEEDPTVSGSQESYAEESLEEYPACLGGASKLPGLPETQPVAIPRSSGHQALSRQAPHMVTSSQPPPLTFPPPTSPPPVAPVTTCRGHKPPPPPKAKSQGDLYAKDKFSPAAASSVTKESSKSSPDLSGSESQQHRQRSVSFMNCSAGAELGRFPADYLGCRQVDNYIGYADTVAKELINSRPIEVMAYVTSEKLRLAPPKNSSVLFKSFAVKDILSVQKCSKNKRIVCVAVWKSKAVPQCHFLRCPTSLVSSALHDSILDQTQNVDDISTHKISMLRSRAPSAVSNDSTTSSTEGDTTTATTTTTTPPQSPSEFLHKIPAIHIGSAKAGRHDSVNDVIQKVLLASQPTAAKEISVWLSLAQLRLVDMSDEREMIFEAHETSRIRAIGVYLVDKRFIGYIIKEEGKPLMGHVLRCNSAALMVSLVSFLRQACQIMFSQQGGSLYDELSTDESDSESTETPSPGHGLMQRLRCITHKPLSPTVSHPTFVSHTPSHHTHSHTSHHHPSTTSSTETKDTPVSPLECTDENFSRFSVTYIGSAVADLPFSSSSLMQALSLFREGGVAAGRAAVVKNVIQMHISALGINLIDKKHRLFVNRNYPRKQLAGYCRHPEDERVFAFGSRRPGYPNEIKCHVFRQVQESTELILEAVHHWLEIDPTPISSI